MANHRRLKVKELPFNKMIPNMLTLLALSAGLTAIRFGLQERWEAAVIAIAVAAVLDGLDGRVARILKGSSKFGAELDSLSDFLAFGIAPAILLYLWGVQDGGRFLWVMVVFFPVCTALRLARFNTALEEPDQPAWTRNFFTGVPSPAGAGLVLLPMILSFQFGDTVFRSPYFVALFLVGIGVLLVSRVPTFSFKKFKVPQRYVLPSFLGLAILAGMIVSNPWLTLSLILIAYGASFPFSIKRHRQLSAETEAEAGNEPERSGLDEGETQTGKEDPDEPEKKP